MNDDKAWLETVYNDYDNWKLWSSDSVSKLEKRLIEVEVGRSGICQPARVLEIGFGSGGFLLHLQSIGFECWGIERRPEHNEALQNAGIKIVMGDVADLPTGHFDLVCAMDVLEHLEKPEILSMLRNVYSVLKPGGRFLARFPNGASPLGSVNQSGDLTHLTTLSISSFSQACCASGLIYVGGWNSAVSWRAKGIARSLFKPMQIIARRIIEISVGLIYFGQIRPLDPNVTVCAERPR